MLRLTYSSTQVNLMAQTKINHLQHETERELSSTNFSVRFGKYITNYILYTNAEEERRERKRRGASLGQGGREEEQILNEFVY